MRTFSRAKRAYGSKKVGGGNDGRMASERVASLELRCAPPFFLKMDDSVSAPRLRGYFKVAVPILVGTGGVLSSVLITMLLENDVLPVWSLWDNAEVNFSFTLQTLMLPGSLAAVMFVYLFDRQAFAKFFRFRIKHAGGPAENWIVLGPLLAVMFALGTTMYMSASVTSQDGQVNVVFFRLLPLVFLLAATNAWTEEIFTRFVIVAGLNGRMSPVAVCWISSLVFGLPHFFGTPSGVFGVIAAGLMGWLLAKSVLETRSMTWALLIHFLQDVIIFGGGAMVIAGQG